MSAIGSTNIPHAPNSGPDSTKRLHEKRLSHFVKKYIAKANGTIVCIVIKNNRTVGFCDIFPNEMAQIV